MSTAVSHTKITPSVIAQSVEKLVAAVEKDKELQVWLVAHLRDVERALISAAVLPAGSVIEFNANAGRLTGVVMMNRKKGPTAGYIEARTEAGIFGIHRSEWRKIDLRVVSRKAARS